MGLTIRTDVKLSECLSYLGCTIFTDGKCQMYDPNEDEYIEPECKAQTILVDKDVEGERGKGSGRYTLTHEVIHWNYNRNHHQLKHQVEGGMAVAHRSSSEAAHEKKPYSEWTDEDRMEWQAETLPGYILMPKIAFIKKFNEFKEITMKETGVKFCPYNLVKIKLAHFFNVSETAAKIRVGNLGLPHET